MAESLHARLTLKSSCPAGPVLAAHQRRRRPIRSSGRLYGPGGCGCALLMAPVMALSVGIALMLMGMAVLAVVALVVAIVLTVRELRRASDGSPARTGMIALISALYLLSVPYLVCCARYTEMELEGIRCQLRRQVEERTKATAGVLALFAAFDAMLLMTKTAPFVLAAMLVVEGVALYAAWYLQAGRLKSQYDAALRRGYPRLERMRM